MNILFGALCSCNWCPDMLMLTAIHSFKSSLKIVTSKTSFFFIRKKSYQWKMMLFALIMVHFKPAKPRQPPWLIHGSLWDVICWLFLPEATVIAAQSYLYSCLRIYVNMHESDKNRVRNIVLKYIFSVIWRETLTHPSHNGTTDTALRAATAHFLHTVSHIYSLPLSNTVTQSAHIRRNTIYNTEYLS